MGKFVYEGERNPGDGSSLPLTKRIKKKLYNLKVSLTRDKDAEGHSVHQFGRAKLKK